MNKYFHNIVLKEGSSQREEALSRSQPKWHEILFFWLSANDM